MGGNSVHLKGAAPVDVELLRTSSTIVWLRHITTGLVEIEVEISNGCAWSAIHLIAGELGVEGSIGIL